MVVFHVKSLPPGLCGLSRFERVRNFLVKKLVGKFWLTECDLQEQIDLKLSGYLRMGFTACAVVGSDSAEEGLNLDGGGVVHAPNKTETALG